MASYNHVVLVGNLTRDVEVRLTKTNLSVASLSIAVSKRTKVGSEWKDETSFFDVTAFGKTAEVAAEYLQKGSPVLIDGELKQETWEKDGRRNSKVVVICNRLTMLGGKNSEPRASEYAKAEAPPASRAPAEVAAQSGDDIPF